MKARLLTPFLILLISALAGSEPAQAGTTPLGTGFTYQGLLRSTSAAANGNYDFQFMMFDAPAGGNQVGPTLTNLNVPVINGIFTTTVDFGPGNFSGISTWLMVSVRTNGSAAAFSTLTPLQPMTPSPNALFARDSAQFTNGLATVQDLNAALYATTNQFGAMAYQPTNGPSFYTGNNYGPMNVFPSGDGGNDTMVNWSSEANIWYNFGHSVEPEWQFASRGSVSWTIGEDGQGKSICHFGGSGAYHSLWFMQLDDVFLTNAPGHSTPFGYALHLNQGATQNFIFGYWNAEQDPGMTQTYRLNWHDYGGKPAPGFNQTTEYMTHDHIAGGLGSNTIFWGGAELTNALTRGNATLSPAATNALDFSYTGTDFLILNPTGPLTLYATNLSYTNLSLVKNVIIHAGHAAVPLTLPANWINLSAATVAANNLPTNVPGSNDLMLHLVANCGSVTNIYIQCSYGWNPF